MVIGSRRDFDFYYIRRLLGGVGTRVGQTVSYSMGISLRKLSTEKLFFHFCPSLSWMTLLALMLSNLLHHKY